MLRGRRAVFPVRYREQLPQGLLDKISEPCQSAEQEASDRRLQKTAGVAPLLRCLWAAVPLDQDQMEDTWIYQVLLEADFSLSRRRARTSATNFSNQSRDLVESPKTPFAISIGTPSSTPGRAHGVVVGSTSLDAPRCRSRTRRVYHQSFRAILPTWRAVSPTSGLPWPPWGCLTPKSGSRCPPKQSLELGILSAGTSCSTCAVFLLALPAQPGNPGTPATASALLPGPPERRWRCRALGFSDSLAKPDGLVTGSPASVA